MSTEEDQPVGLPPLPSDVGQVKAVEEEVPVQQQQVAASSNNNVVSSSAMEEEETMTSYPIDLPSPILLATSMVLAISSIGKRWNITCSMHAFMYIFLTVKPLVYDLSLVRNNETYSEIILSCHDNPSKQITQMTQ